MLKLSGDPAMFVLQFQLYSRPISMPWQFLSGGNQRSIIEFVIDKLLSAGEAIPRHNTDIVMDRADWTMDNN